MTEPELKKIIFESYVKGKMDTIIVLQEFLNNILEDIPKVSQEIFDRAFPEHKDD